MKTLDEVMGRCRIEDCGCWVWAGAQSAGFPRIYGPDLRSGMLKAQPGRRAVWQMVKDEPIPRGHRVWGKCLNDLCVNPDHIDCGTTEQFGRFNAKKGRFKGQPARVLANHHTALKRTTLTPELLNEILMSNETGVQIAARTGLGRTVISKVRTGGRMVLKPAGGLFAGLGAR